ncbi:Putative FAD-containing monooxygenase MymA [Seminavis robusta]|uniref:Amine oxidase n=1 Tax=Seminavis robusta TaxID=568900 RepID=A0A9N8DR47_9STRA|nr:Putative FAD-containing monooxygenase MymA [Seminavis robusta]|eukprot:Sro222_g091220.1 Putative FAD-containing monooxygenase MymA (501) ;mRNA; r:65377-66879
MATEDTSTSNVVEFDALIIGGGVSGVSAAYHLQKTCPSLKFCILEARKNMGGTWDLFDYPGLRSDSDMYTFGFSFRPWASQTQSVIGTKQTILDYLHTVVKEFDLQKHVQFQCQVLNADWDSQEGNWTLTTSQKQNHDDSTTTVIYRARYLFSCTGYYNYEEGYTPEFPNRDAFPGPIIHPQHWPKDLDYKDKNIVVIGSGATAVTLIPSLTEGPHAASHVTMLQRSPTFMASRPSHMTILSRSILYWFGQDATRWFYILFGMFFYNICQSFPRALSEFLIDGVEHQIGSDKFKEDDWTPRYKPWDQRLCACPDGDFFKTIKSGKASVVTDHIVEFTEKGVRTEKNDVLPADIIITATGLKIHFFGGMNITLDQKPLDMPSRFIYKGFMMNGVPNFFVAGGYTNASWTLKIDLTMQAASDLINIMETKSYRYCQPELPKPGNEMEAVPSIDLTSGYIQRSKHLIPSQSTFYPWRLYQNYLYDKYSLQFQSLEDDTLKFSK